MEAGEVSRNVLMSPFLRGCIGRFRDHWRTWQGPSVPKWALGEDPNTPGHREVLLLLPESGE